MFSRSLFTAVLVLLYLATGPVSSASAAEEATPPLHLVAGTELIADIARDLLDGQVTILSLIPAASCPGHHDIRAQDIAFISRADVLIMHHWQQKLPGVTQAVDAANNPKLASFVTPNFGSWLVPENQKKATLAVAAFLATLPGVDASTIEQKTQERLARIESLALGLQGKLAPYANTPALAADMQAELTAWTGMDVVATYGRAEDIPPSLLIQLVEEGRKRQVQLVVDNMQSGAEAGKPLARELGAAHVALSNFPMFSPEIPTYERLLARNCGQILAALEAKTRAGQ